MVSLLLGFSVAVPLLLAVFIGEVIYPATLVGLVLIVIGLCVQRITVKSFLPPRRWRGKKAEF